MALHQPERPIVIDVACDGEDAVGGVIEAEKELLDIVEGGFLHMLYGAADGGPSIGMPLVAEGSQQQHGVAIGLVLVALVVLFGDHLLLHRQSGGREVEQPHTVGFEGQRCVEHLGRDGEVVVGVVVVGESVALASHAVDHHIVVGHRLGAAEHQMLEEVCKACATRVLVACPHIVQQVDGDKRGAVVAMEKHLQSVVEPVSLIGDHRVCCFNA